MRAGKPRELELEGAIAPLRGRDGWLFLTGDSNQVIAQHTGALRPDRAWGRKWERTLRRRRRLLARLGARWVHVVVPDKEAVYADHLPPEVTPVERRPIDDFLEIAERAGAPVLYPLAELRAERERGDVFHRTDTHWTALGFCVAYQLVCLRLRDAGLEPAVLERDELEWWEVSAAGDLGSRLDPAPMSAAARARARRPRARITSDNEIPVTGRTIVFESDLDDAPQAIVFGTSYALLCLALLKESFRRLTYVHSTAIDFDLVRSLRPDAVISMTAERGLLRVPDDRHAARDRARIVERKRAEGARTDPTENARLGLTHTSHPPNVPQPAP